MPSGIINGSTGNQYIDSKIEWSYSQNPANNTSTVTAALYYRRNNTGYQTYGSGTFTISIGGKSTSETKSITITESAWVKAVEATETVSHNSDGSKSVAISASGSIPSTTLTSTSCSGTVKLTTIPRASNISSAASKTLGNVCSVSWTPLSKSFRYKLKFTLGSFSYTTGAIHPNTTSAYTYTGYTLSIADIAPQITSNPPTGTMTVTLYTYSDSGATTQVGSASSKTFKVTVPDNASTKPSVTMTLSSVSSLGSTFSGLYIQGKSRCKATFSGFVGKYNATLDSYGLTVLGKGYASPFQTELLSTPGTVSINGRVKDSRGFVKGVTQNITVIPYSKPKLIPPSGAKAIVCARCDSSGNLSDSGTYLKIKVGRSYSKVMSGSTQKNFCLLRYRYKTASASGYSSYTTILAKNTTNTDYVDVTLGNVVSSTTTSYLVELSVIDDIGESAAIIFNVPTDSVTFHLGETVDGVAVGKYAEKENTFDVADGWDVIGRVRSLGKGKATIPSGADLNNYKEFGVYDVTANVYAENIANCPTGKAGRLIVTSGTGDGKKSGTWVYILQEYITFDGKYHYFRLVYAGATADEWIYGKWECRSDAFWSALGLSSAVSQSNSVFGRYQNGNVWYRVVNENHIYVAFNCAFTFNGDPITVSSTPIPSPYKPARNVYALCPVNNRGIARILVKSDGNILIDYVQSMATGEVTNTYTVTWIDGYIDYWV